MYLYNNAGPFIYTYVYVCAWMYICYTDWVGLNIHMYKHTYTKYKINTNIDI